MSRGMFLPGLTAFAGSLVIASMVLFSRAAPPQPAPSLATPTQPTPKGLVVVIEAAGRDDPSWHQALNNKFISGVALQIHWSDLEPVEGKPDWSRLDELFHDAEKSDKWVQLLTFPGFFTPSWALNGVQTETFAIQYGPGAGTVEQLPLPWDTVYLNRWFAFVRKLRERYAASPAFRMIAAVGPTSVSAEFTLPNSPHDLRIWQKDRYRPSKYIGAWRQVFQEYAADFPRQYVSLSVGSGLDINEQGKIDASEHLRTRDAIVDAAMDALGSRFALQLSDVHAGPGPHSPNSKSEDEFIIGYNGRIVTGFQMRSAAENSSRVMGAAGNPPLALRRSVNLAVEANSTSHQHVNYLEIYKPDVLAAEMQPVLQYADSYFGQHVRRTGK